MILLQRNLLLINSQYEHDGKAEQHAKILKGKHLEVLSKWSLPKFSRHLSSFFQLSIKAQRNNKQIYSMQLIFTKGAEFIWDCHTPSQKCQSSSALDLGRGREMIDISGYRAHEVT